jgi:hypothetical protein
MSTARHILRPLFRLTANLSLIAALILILIWRASYAHPTRLKRVYSLGPADWAFSQDVLASFRGGLWFLELRSFPRDPPWPPETPKPTPTWAVSAPLYPDWEQRLQPEFIGPRRLFGFRAHAYSHKRTWNTRYGDVTIVEQRRTFCVPYTVAFALLITLPAVRALLAIRLRRKPPEATQPRPTFTPSIARSCFEVLASASLVCFALAVWQCAHAFRANTVAMLADDRSSSGYVGSSLEIDRSGWEFAHNVRSNAVTVTGRAHHSGTSFTLSGDAQPLDHLDALGAVPFRLLGFAFARDRQGALPSPHDAWVLRAPHYAVLLATAFLPTVRLVNRLRARGAARRLAGHCRVCGYDLRATPDRCPECGTPAPNSAAGAASNPISAP